MTLTALTKSKKQQSKNWEIQNKGLFKIGANYHLSIFIIKVCEIYLLYTFKKEIPLPGKCDSTIQKQLQRGVLGNICS